VSGAAIELGEFVLPGASAADGALVAVAFHREIGQLWEADQAAGIIWTDSLGTLILDLDPRLAGAELGHAIAREVRNRARRDQQHGGRP